MPVCFCLIPKGTSRVEKLPEVDDKMREAFHAPTDDTDWYLDWYDTIGLMLALGKNWEQIRKVLEGSEELIAIANWLEGRYEVDCWRE